METKHRIRARIRRRSQRGAAMVEAAVSIPFFIVIFMALVFVGGLYVQKMETVRLSRSVAWQYAMANCKGSVPNAQTGEDLGGAQSDTNPPGSSQSMGTSGDDHTSDFKSAPGGGIVSKGVSMSTATMSGDVKTTGKDAQGNSSSVYSAHVVTTTWVPCNEEPVDGDLHGVLKTAWGLFSGW